MKCGARIAAGVAGGYLLGRSKKMKWLLILGTVAAGRRLTSSPGELAEKGKKALDAYPELGKLVNEDIGGRLFESARAAAIKATSDRMDALTDRLGSITSDLQQGPGNEAASAANEEPPRQSSSTASSTNTKEAGAAEDGYDPDDSPATERPPGKPRSPRLPQAPRGASRA